MALRPISVIGATLGVDKLLTKPIVVVTFRTGPKRYAYRNPGFDIKVGDVILVPTESGNDLEATVVLMTSASRWANKATKDVIG